MRTAEQIADDLAPEISSTFQEPVVGYLGSTDSTQLIMYSANKVRVRLYSPTSPEWDLALITPMQLAYYRDYMRRGMKVELALTNRGDWYIKDFDIYGQIANFSGLSPTPTIQLPNLSVGTAQLQNGAVTRIKIADGAINNAKIGEIISLENGGTESDLSAAPAGYLTQLTTGAAVSVIKNNWSSAIDPTTGDDSGDGYSVGSYWYNTTADTLFVCMDATPTLAVWKDLSKAGTVTSVATGTGLTGGTITDTGTISLITPVTMANGANGVDLTALTTGVPIVKNSTATLTAANWTAKALVIGNNTGAPAFLAPSTNRNVAISDGTDWQSRALVAADIPNLDAAKITTGTLLLTRGGTNADLSSMTTGAVVVKNSTATFTSANWTSKSLIIGAGTGAPTFLAPSTNRNVAISDGTDWASRALVDADIPNALTISGGTINDTVIGATNPAAATFDDIEVTFSNNLQTFFSDTATWVVRRSAASTQTGLSIQRSLGSDLDNPSIITSGAVIGSVDWKGWDTSSYGLAAMMQAVATQDFTASARGTKVEILTTNDSSTTTSVRVRITQAGTLEVLNAFAHQGSTFGVFNTTPASRSSLALPTGTIKRTTYATGTVTLAELAGYVMAMATDLKGMGFYS